MISDTSDVVYNIPLEYSKFLTVFYMGYRSSQCSNGKEILNPYSLCGNLPKLYDTITKMPQESLMLTVLSTWKLSYTRERRRGVESTNPATNLLIFGKVKLRHLPYQKK